MQSSGWAIAPAAAPEQADPETLFQAVEGRLVNTEIQHQPAEADLFDSLTLQVAVEAGLGLPVVLHEAGVGVDFRVVDFPDNQVHRFQIQPGMPGLGGQDLVKHIQGKDAVDGGDAPVAPRHRQGAPETEIVLQVGNQQCFPGCYPGLLFSTEVIII